MKFNMKYIILYVNNLEQSIHFYEQLLGLPLSMQQGTYVEFNTGQTTLSLNTRKSIYEDIGLEVPSNTDQSQSFELGFVVDNVEKTIEYLRNHDVKIIKEATLKPWGQTVAYVSDPDGHYIEICTAIE